MKLKSELHRWIDTSYKYWLRLQIKWMLMGISKWILLYKRINQPNMIFLLFYCCYWCSNMKALNSKTQLVSHKYRKRDLFCVKRFLLFFIYLNVSKNCVGCDAKTRIYINTQIMLHLLSFCIEYKLFPDEYFVFGRLFAFLLPQFRYIPLCCSATITFISMENCSTFVNKKIKWILFFVYLHFGLLYLQCKWSQWKWSNVVINPFNFWFLAHFIIFMNGNNIRISFE